jgi:hypothetical protein
VLVGGHTHSVRFVQVLLLHSCYTFVTLLLHCCYTVVTLLSFSRHTIVTPGVHLIGPNEEREVGACGAVRGGGFTHGGTAARG